MGSVITTCWFLLWPASLFLFINMFYTFSLWQNNTDGFLRQKNITSPCNLISCCSASHRALVRNRTRRQIFHISLLLRSRSVLFHLSILGKSFSHPPSLPKCHGLLTPLRTNPLKGKGWMGIQLRQSEDWNRSATEASKSPPAFISAR